ncbi:phage tail sheath subtilisin-like domain-containing protein [Candidatus Manganitrophus noduliformans]|uniref:Phage tail sheath family protein n=1 Tax=Candidatus Manganitrophus noduliformans TaxID=2606439 RepID=A0A7X6I9K8_9BACT|nr:phage tail sheath subtilisin-like domain-containing protein [Candidatus Manganitrophus noduliformans]NKE69578.1 phage tail sheath family protein [Candidatus Manganitrophus noduliformans]
MERLHPGVYIEEVPSGVRPIEGVSTSTAAFIGKAEKGPLDRALMVTSFIEFQATYGTFQNDSYLAHAALQFFNNGGKRLYIVRVANGAVAADVAIVDRKGTPAKTLTIFANSPGAWGNALDIDVADGAQDSGNEFKITVKLNGTPLEIHDNLSMNPDATNFVENVVTANSKLIKAVVDPANDTTNRGTSVSGASPATTLPAGNRKMVVNVNGDGPQTITLANPLTTGGEIATAIETAVRALVPLRGSTPTAAFTAFTAGFATGVYTLTSGAGGKRSSVQVTNAPSENGATLLKLGRNNGGVEQAGAAVLRPAVGANYHVGDAAVAGNVISATLGSDGITPQEIDYQNGFALLDVRRDVNIVAVPGIGSKTMVDFGGNYCRNRQDCFFVGDMGAADDTKEEAQAFVTGLTVKSSYAAVYFPWLKAIDPTGVSPEPILLPPSGYVAGMYARIDSRRGVWKAPAGTEANIGGAVGLTKEITDAEQDTLNPIGVNVIRVFPASGIVIWGARTVATQADPEYRYVPVRRTAIFIEQSIYNGIQWAVFEPNDEDLWASLRLNIGAFMMTLFRAGAFQGATPSQAFFVKADSQTTTQADIDAGVVNVMVGFAPLKPAEFVVIKISQKAGESA